MGGIKIKGKLAVDSEGKLSITTKLKLMGVTSDERFEIPVEEIVEEFMEKEVEIQVIEIINGKPALHDGLDELMLKDMVKHSRALRERFLMDKYRPGYHFAIPDDIGMPGDPNGAFFGRDGRYHLMYLYNRRDETFCWGHISSIDLVHWRHHQDAIARDGDIDGCFSGGAFLDDDGTVYLSYWIVQDNERVEAKKGIAIAKSSDYHYERWENFPDVAIEAHSMGISKATGENGDEKLLANADPSNIWKKDGIYYMQTGNLPLLNEHGRDPKDPLFKEMHGDWVDLFKSRDLVKWDYVHRFYDYNPGNNWTDGTEDDMCPSFLPLPSRAEGGQMSGKYLQLFISHNKGCQYYIGTYDEDNDKFIPESHGRMTWIDNTFFAPEALIDGRGRQIMWAWLLDNMKDDNRGFKKGWSGVYGLPRILWLGDDGTLRIAPPPELEVLRCNESRWARVTVEDKEEMKLDIPNGESCELSLVMDPISPKKVGFKIRASPGFEEKTIIYVDFENDQLVFDSLSSSMERLGRPALEKAPFHPLQGEKMHMRVFIDKSVVEVFVNDRQAITRRVYPVRSDSLDVYLFAEGNMEIKEIIAWELMESNPY
ncbi:MAG: glycoside hydrolase family 32 protein [Promethearchaeota archaeon]